MATGGITRTRLSVLCRHLRFVSKNGDFVLLFLMICKIEECKDGSCNAGNAAFFRHRQHPER